MSVHFNAPPGWPVPLPSWTPGDDWMPDPSWPAAPDGWTFWLVVDDWSGPDLGELCDGYGTDRGTWLAGLRPRGPADAFVAATSWPAAADTPWPEVDADDVWQRDGLLASAGGLDV